MGYRGRDLRTLPEGENVIAFYVYLCIAFEVCLWLIFENSEETPENRIPILGVIFCGLLWPVLLVVFAGTLLNDR